MPKPKYPV